MENKTGGFSDAENAAIGRMLLAAVILVVGVPLLPMLTIGFLIGLIWYGAYAEDDEANFERLFWPVLTTLALFVYWLGFPTPFSNWFEGILFTDLNRWTLAKVAELLVGINQILPRKYEFHSATVVATRNYIWLSMALAIITVGFLIHKGAGRGVFIFQGCRALLTPFRMLAVDWKIFAGLAGLSAAAWLMIGLPHWLTWGLIFTIPLIGLYFLTDVGWESSGRSGQPRAQSERKDEPILLGAEIGRSSKKIRLTSDQLNHHVHVVGASGFGKSVLLSHIIQNRIQLGSGLLFVDLKADFETIRQVVSVAKASGRLDDLSIFSCGNADISSPYNVVARGTANQLKDRVMGALNWSEEFYKNEAASFVLKLLRGLTLLRDQQGQAFDLGTILKCTADPKAIESVIDQIPPVEKDIVTQLEDLASALSKPEKYKALQGLRSQLESLMLSDIGPLLRASSTGIDLFEAIAKRKIVYVLLDSRTYGDSARALGKLILQDLKAASARVDNEIPRDQRTPFTVVVDEFSDLATEEFLGFLDRARSSKMGVVVAHQEIADLSRISPEFSHRLMNSTSTLFAFLQKVPQTSELIASISGTKATKKVTEQAKDNWLFGDEKTGMKSIRDVEEFVIHPNTVRSLKVGECVMVAKYPKSMSAVVKVRPEAKNYLSEDEVRRALSKIKARHRLDSDEIKILTMKPRPPTAPQHEGTNDRNQEMDRF